MSQRLVIVTKDNTSEAQANVISQYIATVATFWLQCFKSCWLVIDQNDRGVVYWQHYLLAGVPGVRFLVFEVGNNWGGYVDNAQHPWLQLVWDTLK